MNNHKCSYLCMNYLSSILIWAVVWRGVIPTIFWTKTFEQIFVCWIWWEYFKHLVFDWIVVHACFCYFIRESSEGDFQRHKGIENRRTSWDSEVLWWGGVLEETWIPVCFCTELEQKMTFQNFPLKGKWDNFQFRKIKRCVLSFPKWNNQQLS